MRIFVPHLSSKGILTHKRILIINVLYTHNTLPYRQIIPHPLKLWQGGGVECFASEYSEIDFLEFEGEWWGLD